MRSSKWHKAIAAAGAVLVAAGCSTGGDGAGSDAEQGGGVDQAAAAEQAPTEPLGPAGEAGESGAAPGEQDPAAQDPAAGPNLDDVPDPVAEVNGTEISKDEFASLVESQYQQMSMQAQMSGQPVDEKQIRDQAIEGLVGTTLLEQEAGNRGLEVTDDEVDAELTEFAKTNQVSTDEFVAKMGEQGMDRQGVMEQIESQLLIEKLVTEEYGEFSATEEELRAAYDQVAQQQQSMGGAQGGAPGGGAQQVPPFEQVRDQVAEQLKSEKQANDMQTLFEELRGDADVKVHI